MEQKKINGMILILGALALAGLMNTTAGWQMGISIVAIVGLIFLGATQIFGK